MLTFMMTTTRKVRKKRNWKRRKKKEISPADKKKAEILKNKLMIINPTHKMIELFKKKRHQKKK
jgi:hypothetical protein